MGALIDRLAPLLQSDPTVLWAMFKQFLLLSLLSVGGANTTVSEMHRFMVIEHGWIDDTRFTELYAISQAAPGPNVLFVALFGIEAAGLAGLVVAMLGICGPSSVLALLLERAAAEPRNARWLGLARRSLAPLTVGLVLATGVVLARGAATDVATALLIATTVAAMLRTRAHPLLMIAIGAAIGAALPA
jgi:chromate transporter